ncbi:conserved hypothetical protein [Solidesulfovibrio fructosivorans JJ]]|uniref:Uncharacterized protein n=1 Tax=Solidesulfovibrio fructosivorans JJ] TaxID=596151 RepID=E1JSI9_SOLFR|nr:hypothetical protein [Solidesulfovibrio fructosivorans]EFL52674.1 conserved hypothetical protein [Solidesulfovibrio fructosivorans JJ]]
MDGNETRRIDRLEAALKAAHDTARRERPPLDPRLSDAVLAAIKAAPEPEETNNVLWRMAAGAGMLAAATVLLVLFFGSGLEDEFGRFLFFDPNSQVLVSLLGV